MGTTRLVLCREVVLFQRQFSIECVYTSTFGLSFVGRFVLFWSVLYRRFQIFLVCVCTCISTCSPTLLLTPPPRSPDSKHPHDAPISHDHVLFITVGQPPDVAPQLYQPQPGQVFMAEDVSQVEVWKVRALSGDMAGESVWVQRNCLEEYSAPMSLRGWKKEYQVLQSLSV